MFGISLEHTVATVAVAAGVLAAAGPASAGYQHHQTDREVLARGFAIDVGTSEEVASDGLGADFSLLP